MRNSKIVGRTALNTQYLVDDVRIERMKERQSEHKREK